MALLKLVRGKRYGLVGRNGIGKTCLINAISRSEIEHFPQGIHILQVEQEIEADEKSCLDHILDCDVERKALLAEFDEITNSDDSKLSSKVKKNQARRLTEVSDRLETIEASEAEEKATDILLGIGF